MGTMDKILAILGITTAVFIIVCFVFVWYGRVIPDSLIYSYFAIAGGEEFVMGWIKNTNTKEKNGGGKNE